MGHPGLVVDEAPLSHGERHLEPEELVEDESPAGRPDLAQFIGEVDPDEGRVPVDEVASLDHVGTAAPSSMGLARRNALSTARRTFTGVRPPNAG